MVTASQRGGDNANHGIYLDGGKVSDTWTMSEYRYRFSTQRRDERHIKY
jgi:hypothetical protein